MLENIKIDWNDLRLLEHIYWKQVAINMEDTVGILNG